MSDGSSQYSKSTMMNATTMDIATAINTLVGIKLNSVSSISLLFSPFGSIGGVKPTKLPSLLR